MSQANMIMPDKFEIEKKIFSKEQDLVQVKKEFNDFQLNKDDDEISNEQNTNDTNSVNSKGKNQCNGFYKSGPINNLKSELLFLILD